MIMVLLFLFPAPWIRQTQLTKYFLAVGLSCHNRAAFLEFQPLANLFQPLAKLLEILVFT